MTKMNDKCTRCKSDLKDNYGCYVAERNAELCKKCRDDYVEIIYRQLKEIDEFWG